MREVIKFSIHDKGSRTRTTFRVAENNNFFAIEEYLPNTKKWIPICGARWDSFHAVLSSSMFQQLFFAN